MYLDIMFLVDYNTSCSIIDLMKIGSSLIKLIVKLLHHDIFSYKIDQNPEEFFI